MATMFHMNPSPSGLRLVPWLVENFGWPLQNSEVLSFRQTLSYGRITSRGFSIGIDYSYRRIFVQFDASLIDPALQHWRQQLISNGMTSLPNTHVPYWGFNDLQHAAGRKLVNCFFIGARSRGLKSPHSQVRYETIKIMSDFNFYKFLKTLRAGKIWVDFDARQGHDHGVKFRIKASDFPSLYDHCEDI